MPTEPTKPTEPEKIPQQLRKEIAEELKIKTATLAGNVDVALARDKAELQGMLKQADKKMDEVLVSFSRTKLVLRVLVGAVTFGFVLLLGLGAVALEARHAVAVAKHNLCLSGNDFRSLDHQRWLDIITITGATKSPQEALQRQQFLTLIDRTDALRKC